MAENKLEFILHRDKPGNAADCFGLYACRGVGRGCERNKHRKNKAKCDDCLRADENETLGAFQERLNRMAS